MSWLAIEWLPWVGGALALFVVVVAVALVAPWRHHEGPLDPEVQARLLLGEDPAEIERDLEARDADSASVADLRPEE